MRRCIYIELTIVSVIAAFFCFLLKLFRMPGDEIIFRLPDVTFHDIIYFEASWLLDLFGLIATVNLCYFIESIYRSSMLVNRLTTLLLVMTGIILGRCVGNFITYDILTYYEIGFDILITLVILFFRYFKKGIWHYQQISYNNRLNSTRK